MLVFVMGLILGAVGTTIYLERAELRTELKSRLRRFVEEEEPASEGAPPVPTS